MTDRQAQVLARFASLLDRDGYPPMVRELGASLGCSISVVFSYLDALIDEGYVARFGLRKARALSLTPAGRVFVDTALRITAAPLELDEAEEDHR